MNDIFVNMQLIVNECGRNTDSGQNNKSYQ